MPSWAVDKQEQRALKSPVCVLFAASAGVAVVAVVGAVCVLLRAGV